MHRDIKPENLLLDQDCTLKITDFGLAVNQSDPSACMSNYVVTRWYRSPELLCSQEEFDSDSLFTPAIDVWSVGCIFGELLRRKPLFPGEDTLHQLQLVLTVLGAPKSSQMSQIKEPRIRNYLKSAGQARIPLFECVPEGTSEVAFDLLSKMLEFDPAQRLTARECLEHPYFAEIHNDHSPTNLTTTGVSLALEVDPNITVSTALAALFDECVHFG